MKLYFAKEFSRFPYGKTADDGANNGEKFRSLLADRFAEAQKKNEKLEIILDNVRGMNSGFMRAAFGEFAREKKEREGLIISDHNLDFEMDSPLREYYIDLIWEYIDEHNPDQIGERPSCWR